VSDQNTISIIIQGLKGTIHHKKFYSLTIYSPHIVVFTHLISSVGHKRI